jgi:hypothetical protein
VGSLALFLCEAGGFAVEPALYFANELGCGAVFYELADFDERVVVCSGYELAYDLFEQVFIFGFHDILAITGEFRPALRAASWAA